MITDDTVESELLLALQRGLPLVPRPFAVIGERIGADEGEVLEYVTRMMRSGTARRLGAVFDSKSLGYDSTLCGVAVPAAHLEEVTMRLTPHPGITHCYEREGQPNLWFTLTARKDRFDAERAGIDKLLHPFELLDLPARRMFKIEAVFDARLIGRSDSPLTHRCEMRHSLPRELDLKERAVVRRIQDSIPFVPEPFAALGAELGWTPDDLLTRLSQWEQSGILRRIGLIVRHHKLGFAANGMCVWSVDPAQTVAAGQVLAGFPEVTHCYERRLHARFPFNLFAMIHGGNGDDVRGLWERLTEAAGLTDGQLLMSTREFKKSSPRFFEEA